MVSGYSGGNLENPTTEQIYAGGSGHAEVVQITFDPKIITYKKLLEIFFVMHDPTTLNRQGYDVGEIYRSVIFYMNDMQKALAESTITEFAPSIYDDPVVTELKSFEKFWPADESMQDYFERNPNTGYCQIIIAPKILKLRQKYTELLA